MNKNILNKIFIFVVGSAVGSVVTWKLIETKYKRIAQEEIDSVREVYARVHGDPDEEPDEDQEVIEEVPDEYYDIIQSNGYGENDEADEEKEEDYDEEMISKPYVISEEEYDDNGYETETLYYYDDGMLVYSITDEAIYEVDEVVGEDSLTQLLESGEDYIYVRNDELGIDFEILRDRRNYSEVE